MDGEGLEILFFSIFFRANLTRQSCCDGLHQTLMGGRGFAVVVDVAAVVA